MGLKQKRIVNYKTLPNGDKVFEFPVTLAECIEGLVDMIYPVGSLFWNELATVDPNKQFPGTAWEQVKDKFILAAGDTYKAGNTGGAATVALTTAQIPAHAHTRGTMNITGNVWQGRNSDLPSSVPNGAFYLTTASDGGANGMGSEANTIRRVSMDASKSWTGSTSSVGSGSAHENMPPYITMYCWKRTA